jgi:hypothetical protein
VDGLVESRTQSGRRSDISSLNSSERTLEWDPQFWRNKLQDEHPIAVFERFFHLGESIKTEDGRVPLSQDRVSSFQLVGSF